MMLLTHTADAEGIGALPWQESFTSRLEALALLQTLNAELLSHHSATLTLDPLVRRPPVGLAGSHRGSRRGRGATADGRAAAASPRQRDGACPLPQSAPHLRRPRSLGSG